MMNNNISHDLFQGDVNHSLTASAVLATMKSMFISSISVILIIIQKDT